MDAVRTIGECDAYQVQRAGLRVGRRGSGGRSNRQSPPCSRLLSRICAARGSARTAFALAHVGCGVSLTEVGHLFERDRTTVSHACGLVEDGRDDPDFDYRLNHLERAVSCRLDALSMRQGRG